MRTAYRSRRASAAARRQLSWVLENARCSRYRNTCDTTGREGGEAPRPLSSLAAVSE